MEDINKIYNQIKNIRENLLIKENSLEMIIQEKSLSLKEKLEEKYEKKTYDLEKKYKEKMNMLDEKYKKKKESLVCDKKLFQDEINKKRKTLLDLIDYVYKGLDNERVKLNVGGVLFETYKNTLTNYPLSYFGVMFSNKFETNPDENGYYFIDRNGQLFEQVLEFMRTGYINLKKITKELKNEFEFYGLIDYIEQKKVYDPFNPVYKKFKKSITITNIYLLNNFSKKKLVRKIDSFCLDNQTIVLEMDGEPPYSEDFVQTVKIHNTILKVTKKNIKEVYKSEIDFLNVESFGIDCHIFLYNEKNYINLGRCCLVGILEDDTVVVNYENRWFIVELKDKTYILNNFSDSTRQVII